MAQGYRKTKPANLDPLLSEPVRTNFNSLATGNLGATPPADPEEGWEWVDTSDETNIKLKRYINGSWLTILNNLAGGAPSQSTVEKFTHTEASAILVWTVTHNLDTREFTITVFDDTGRVIIPDEIFILSDNSVRISFNTVTAGKAIVIG